MASDPAYRVHGIWSKLFTEFIRNQSPISVVSFSDNRLFSGGVYEKMGFRYDGEVLPDYYWIRNGSRYHKSAMRKTTAEKMSGLTEKILRENQGYRRIWDLGKKRWIWHLGKATPDPQFGYPSQQ
jgi:predicted acetyltransferase